MRVLLSGIFWNFFLNVFYSQLLEPNDAEPVDIVPVLYAIFFPKFVLVVLEQ